MITIEERVAYKIIDYEDGKIKTLFHGVNGSRVLKPHKWYYAEKKMVSDGSSSTKYLSGFHVLASPADCFKYIKQFKKIETKAVVKCRIAGELRSKEHSPHPIYLADEICIMLPIMPYRNDEK